MPAEESVLESAPPSYFASESKNAMQCIGVHHNFAFGEREGNVYERWKKWHSTYRCYTRFIGRREIALKTKYTIAMSSESTLHRVTDEKSGALESERTTTCKLMEHTQDCGDKNTSINKKKHKKTRLTFWIETRYLASMLFTVGMSSTSSTYISHASLPLIFLCLPGLAHALLSLAIVFYGLVRQAPG